MTTYTRREHDYLGTGGNAGWEEACIWCGTSNQGCVSPSPGNPMGNSATCPGPSGLSIHDVGLWQNHRFYVENNEGRSSAKDEAHNVVHIAKALGPLAARAEHRDHGQPDSDVEPKRAADLIIHAIWLVRALGFDPAKVVQDRIDGFEDGFMPLRREAKRNPFWEAELLKRRAKIIGIPGAGK